MLFSPVINPDFLNPISWHAHSRRCCKTANSVAGRTDKLCVSRFCRIVMKINSQAAACEISFPYKFANTVHVLDVLRLNKVCYSVPLVASRNCHHLAITDRERALPACCIYMWTTGRYIYGSCLATRCCCSLLLGLLGNEIPKHRHILFSEGEVVRMAYDIYYILYFN